MGVIKTILFILLVYYGLQFVSRYILPLILKKAVSKAQENMKNQYKQDDQTKEGEISVDYAPKTDSTKKTVGEYIDFEEVDSKTNKPNT